MAKNARRPRLGYERTHECRFAGVSVGKDTCRIGVRLDRCEMEDAEALELFVGRQLRVKLECDPNSKQDAEGQGQLIDGNLLGVETVAESKRLGVAVETFGVSLHVCKDAVEVGELARFANLRGRLHCTSVGGKEGVEE